MSKQILYFPPKEYSPRYGNHFFTVLIKNYEIEGHPSACGGQYAVYILEISQGKRKWMIKKRFREFDSLNQSLQNELQQSTQLPSLPPKTCFTTLDQQFLINRQTQLKEFLNNLLTTLSNDNLLCSESATSLISFLDLKI